MDINDYSFSNGEKPLDKMVTDGGFCGILRSVACIGDSLSSGEFESADTDGRHGYHDFYEYSWGQFMARMTGNTVYNFSRGGMTAKEYWDSFADLKGFWNTDKLCRSYIIALGVNDIFGLGQEIGSVADINTEDYNKNADTFCGYLARIIQRLKEMQPRAKFFLVSMPREAEGSPFNEKARLHSELLNSLSEFFDNTYVIDLYRYAPVYDEEFRKRYFLLGHMNAMGYLLTARMITSYIDYIIRSKPEEFAQVGYIGTTYTV